MRSETDPAKLEEFMRGLGAVTSGSARVYLTGGGTALLLGWRKTTVDIDISANPEPAHFFEAIARLKEELQVNVELVAPSDFIPPLPGWEDRSLFIARYGEIDFYHYDPYSQALSKLERGHRRDLADVDAMFDRGLVKRDRLWGLFTQIESDLIRYPATEPAAFRSAVLAVCGGAA